LFFLAPVHCRDDLRVVLDCMYLENLKNTGKRHSYFSVWSSFGEFISRVYFQLFSLKTRILSTSGISLTFWDSAFGPFPKLSGFGSFG